MRSRIRYLLVAVLVGVILICPAMAASAFPDVNENAAYAEAVKYLKDTGIMQGDERGNFNPNQTVTRAEMAAIVCRMLGKASNLTTAAIFSDVPAGHWANKYVTQAAALSIVNGYGDGKFGPSDKVTYEQAVTMLIRAIGREQQANQLGGYPNGHLEVAKSVGLLSGVSSTRNRYLCRYEIAVMAFNCREFWTQNGQTPQPSNQLADGEYSVRIFADKIGRDQAGNELAYVEIFKPVILNNDFVRSLRAGSQISLRKYGLAYEIEVTMKQKSDSDIWINEYARLSPYQSGWIIYEHDLPIEYISDRKELIVSSTATIIDGCTGVMEGVPEDRKFDNLQMFLDENAVYTSEWNAIITVSGGKVVKVYIPYRPML